MGGRKTYITVLALLFFTFNSAAALTIGVSPGVINFHNMVKAGYAEREVVLSTSSQEALTGHFEVQGDIVGWVKVSPDSMVFNVSSNEPYRFNVVIQPPPDAKNGNYSGYLRMQTDSLASVSSGAGSSIIAAVAVKINVEVTGEEAISCSAGAISVSSTEIDMPVTVFATVSNTGNVRLRPKFQMEIKDFTGRSLYSTSFLGNEILPTTSKRIVKDIKPSLSIGQYFADVFLPECGITRTQSFDVVEKGGIADSGDFIGIRANRYGYINELNPIIAMFRNIGPRTVVAKFKGQITKDGKIVLPLETEEVSIEPGNQFEFNMLFQPKEAGRYQIAGRVFYNKKVTPEEKSIEMDVIARNGTNPGMPLIIIVYIIIGLAILILISKIRKERRRR